MKKIIPIIVVLLIIVAYFNVLVPTAGQALVSTNYYTHKLSVYNGITFKLPIVEHVEYINLTKHVDSVVLNLSVVESMANLDVLAPTHRNYQVGLMLVWHVANPLAYVRYLKTHQDASIAIALKNTAQDTINTQLKKLIDIYGLYTVQLVPASGSYLASQGIILDELKLVQVLPLAKN